MAPSYGYSVILEPQEHGGFTVLVPVLPEVVTGRRGIKEARPQTARGREK